MRCFPIGVRDLLPGHDVVTAAYAGLAGISNGDMIVGAIGAGFEVIVTLDRGIPHQQQRTRYPTGFVLIDDNDVALIRPSAEPPSVAIAGNLIRANLLSAAPVAV